MWDEGNVIAIVILSVYIVSPIMALWWYAKAKGFGPVSLALGVNTAP